MCMRAFVVDGWKLKHAVGPATYDPHLYLLCWQSNTFANQVVYVGSGFQGGFLMMVL